MATRCPSCTSTDIVTDDSSGVPQVVCTQCGHVIDQNNYEDEDETYTGKANYCPVGGPATGMHSSKMMSRLKPGMGQPVVSKTKRDAIMDTHRLCKVQGFSESVTNEVTTLFDRAYSHPKFIRRSLPVKRALGGACFYIICRLHSWPVLVQAVASACQTSKAMIFELFHIVVKEFDIHVPLNDIQFLVPDVLHAYSITDELIHQKTFGICELALDTWIAPGRGYEPMILAAAYLAWCSLGRGKTLSHFGKQCQRKIPQSTYQRLIELKEVIVTLAKDIPWISKSKCKVDYVHLLLDDVLNHKRTLVSKAKSTREDSTTGVDADRNAFLPPSLKKRKRNCATEQNEHLNEVIVDPEHDLSSVDLTESDIPDSELPKYIRSPEEVQERQKLLDEQDKTDCVLLECETLVD